MAQVLGLISVFWNGNQLNNEPGGTVKLGGVRNKAVVYGNKVGNAQSMMPSEINCNCAIEAGTRITDQFGTGSGELQVQCDTGQTFVWDDAFLVDALELTAGEGGKLKLNWNAGEPVEI